MHRFILYPKQLLANLEEEWRDLKCLVFYEDDHREEKRIP